MEFTEENVKISHKAKKVLAGNQLRFDKENLQRGIVHDPVQLPPKDQQSVAVANEPLGKKS